MLAFFKSPPEPVTSGKKPWVLLFNPEACNKNYAGKSLEEMELEETVLRDHALTIT